MTKNKADILMSIYIKVSEKELIRLFESIKNQTSYYNKFIIICDGLIKKSIYLIIRKYMTKLKIHLIKLKQNVGLGAALNEGIKYSTNKYIIRIDADDEVLPNRFEKQILFMEKNPEIVASSCSIEYVDQVTKKSTIRSRPNDPNKLIIYSKYHAPLSHAASIIRLKILKEVGGYPNLRRSQDVCLWHLFISKNLKISNQDFVGYRVFIDKNFISRISFNTFFLEIKAISYVFSIRNFSIFWLITVIFKRLILSALPSFILRYFYVN